MKFKNCNLIFLCFLVLIQITACNPTTNTIITQKPAQNNSNPPSDLSCDFAQLTGYVHAENNIKSIQGIINLSNYAEQPCLINSTLEISIIDQYNNLIIAELIPVENKTMDTNNYLSIDFFWENFCDQVAEQSYNIQIKDIESNQLVRIPIEDPNGNLITNHPTCKDKNLDQNFLLQIYPIN